ncbi:hypothetical protein H4F47_10325 [Pectobacterium brasiliense]|uniref:hypothetical protein n=1 Tax=Pectobacterium brasiliense TaxID=180957 RepID=UPI0019696860|nr:hypothetical protein [Pectobacterium brasiliense]MBN3043314.1 hypothetical protein [Pectobacterium brasiliense]
MIDAIPGAIAAIKESLSLFSAMNESHKKAEIDAAVFEIRKRLNEILEENTRLIESLNDKAKAIVLLEKLVAENVAKNNEKEKWVTESMNYEAWNPMVGTTLYRRKPSESPTTENTNFCAHCYESGNASALTVKSVETIRGVGARIATLVCHKCKSSYLAPASKLKKAHS